MGQRISPILSSWRKSFQSIVKSKGREIGSLNIWRKRKVALKMKRMKSRKRNWKVKPRKSKEEVLSNRGIKLMFRKTMSNFYKISKKTENSALTSTYTRTKQLMKSLLMSNSAGPTKSKLLEMKQAGNPMRKMRQFWRRRISGKINRKKRLKIRFFPKYKRKRWNIRRTFEMF